VVILLALPMTLSRAAILGLAVALLVLLPTWSGARRAGVLLGGAVLTVAMRFVVPGLLGTLRSLFEHVGVDPSISGRTDDYEIIGEFIGRSPWLGRGFGTFLPSEYFILDNQYLGTMVDTGAVGLVAFALLLVTGVARARRARARSTDPVVRDLGASLASSVVVAAVGMLTFDGLAFPVFAGLLFVLLGLTGALWRVTRPAVEGVEPVLAAAGVVDR
jgi:polysaccharide biosynthesis protein PslJ